MYVKVPYFRDTKYEIFYIFLKKPSARILSLTILQVTFDYNGVIVGVTTLFLENQLVILVHNDQSFSSLVCTYIFQGKHSSPVLTLLNEP